MRNEASLDTIYTADEAAERLRINKRALIKFARNTGACSRLGRNYLFSEKDILDIWQAMRAPPIQYYGRATPYQGSIHQSEDAYANLRRLVEERRKRKK